MSAERVVSDARLRDLYARPGKAIERKVIDHVDPHARRFIELSPFCCIATHDAEGHADASPRGDVPGFVRVLDEHRLFLPDRPGNNRVDSMRNLLEEPHIGMLFLIPGIFDVLRVNGRAEIVDAPELLTPSAISGKTPRTGLLVTVEEVFIHCGRAVKRSRLWDPEAQIDRGTLPKLADMVRDQIASSDREVAGELEDLREERYMDRLY